MAEKLEKKYAAEFILSEAWGERSRENVTVLSGENLKVGAVVGRVAIGVGKADIPTVAGTGNGVMTKLFAGPDIEKGSYLVKLLTAVANGGTFEVKTPSGKLLPNLVLTAGAGVTTAFTSTHINFSITDGSTDFAVNDLFTIVVTTGAPSVVGTGDGVVSAISLGPDAKAGQYLAECIEAITNSGVFKIVGPDGEVVAVGTVVVSGSLVLTDQRQLNVDIADGSTDFVVGDLFEFFVFNEGERGLGKVAAWNPLTFDGRNKASGVLHTAVDATAADKAGVIVARDAEVREADLDYAAAITAGQKAVAKQQLLSNQSIVVR